MTSYYTIENQTKYFIDVKSVPSIEDCDGVFYSYEELNEMGTDTCWTVTNRRYFTKKIQDAIEGYLHRIPEGKKTIEVDDEELLTLLKDNSEGYGISEFVRNPLRGKVRRTGNRIGYKTSKPTRKRKPTFNDYKTLIAICEAHLESQGVEVKILKSSSNRGNTIRMINSIISYKQIKDTDWNEKIWYGYKVDLKMIKMLLDKPDEYVKCKK